MTDAARRKAAGWPARLSETSSLRVRLKREVETRSNVIAAGTLGRLHRNPPSSWDRFSFIADACPRCKCSLAVSRMSWRDLEVVR